MLVSVESPRSVSGNQNSGCYALANWIVTPLPYNEFRADDVAVC